MQLGDAASGQYVTFYVSDEAYGINLEYVREIIRVPAITRIPRTPAYLEGLANLRGNILPVEDTRVRFGLDKAPLSETSRVIVLDDGYKRLGFIVDRVSEVMNIAAGEIEAIGEAGARAELLKGVARPAAGENLVLVVDAALLMASDENKGQALSVDRFRHDGSGERRQDTGEEEVQLVSFRLGAEEYGLEIGVVQEIVHLPGIINQVPNAPGYLVGVTSLRNRILPVVSLRALLSLGQKEADERTRVVVVRLAAQEGRAAVGLVVDAVSEVLRIPRALIDPVPALLRTVSGEAISGVCKLADGKRLVSVLDTGKILSVGDLLEVGVVEEFEQEQGDGARGEEIQLVTFRLGREEFAAGVTEVQEIIRVPEIVAVPRAPQFVEGVINLRGAIIPVLDLRQRLGMETKPRDESTRVVVVEMGGLLTGLVVDAVQEVLKVPCSCVEAAPDVVNSAMDGRFISGIAKAKGGERLIIVVNVGEVLSFKEKEELAEFEQSVGLEAGTGSDS